jgi:copper(I)-binding protein
VTCALISAAAEPPSALLVQDAWVRQTPGVDVAAAYLTLHNTGTRAVTIVGIQSPIARTAMIHETKIEGGMSRMRLKESVRVGAGETVKLEPGGLHAMLMGLTHPLTVGESVPLVLKLGDGTSLQALAAVRPL